MTCDELRDLAAELALGVVSGPERAAALEHLGQCVECRTLVDELSNAADALVLLAPEAEPPLGFESRVVARMAGKRHRRRWPLTGLVGAAAVVLVALATVAFVALRVGDGGHAADRSTASADVLSAALHDPAGEEVGYAVVVSEHQPWLSMWMHSSGAAGTISCRLVLADGREVEVGKFQLTDGRGSWSGALTVRGADIRSARLVSDAGVEVATASFD